MTEAQHGSTKIGKNHDGHWDPGNYVYIHIHIHIITIYTYTVYILCVYVYIVYIEHIYIFFENAYSSSKVSKQLLISD